MRAGSRGRGSGPLPRRRPRASLPEARHSPKRTSPTERSVARTEPCSAVNDPRRKGTAPDDVRQADHPAGLGVPRAAGSDPGMPAGDEEKRRGDLRRGQRHLRRPPFGPLHLSVDPHRGRRGAEGERPGGGAEAAFRAHARQLRRAHRELLRPGREPRHLPSRRTVAGREPGVDGPLHFPGIVAVEQGEAPGRSRSPPPFPRSPPGFRRRRSPRRETRRCRISPPRAHSSGRRIPRSRTPRPPARSAAGPRGRRRARPGTGPSPRPSPPRRGSSRPLPLFPRRRRDSGTPRPRPLPATPRPPQPNGRNRKGRSPAPRPSIPTRSATDRRERSTSPRRWP